jgi:hypothetical protein
MDVIEKWNKNMFIYLDHDVYSCLKPLSDARTQDPIPTASLVIIIL